MNEKEWCLQYFSKPEWNRQIAAMTQKYVSLGHTGGYVSLLDATAEECQCAGDFMGRHFQPPVLKYKIQAFEHALQISRFQIACLSEFLELLSGGKLRTSGALRAESRQAHTRLFDTARSICCQEHTLQWLNELDQNRRCGAQLLSRQLSRDPEAALSGLIQICHALDQLPVQRRFLHLAVFASQITSNPHAFDAGTFRGELLLHALAFLKGVQKPDRAEDRLQLLRAFGVTTDDLSSITYQRGLILCDGSGEHPSYRHFRHRMEDCALTLSSLNRLCAADSPQKQVWVVENQMVFSQLCQRMGDEDVSLICTSGQPKTASLVLLDLLTEGGSRIYYSGDFDPEGLEIAQRLFERYPQWFHFWRFQRADYEKARSGELLSSERMARLRHIHAPGLAEAVAALRSSGYAAYQEKLLDDMVEDIRSSRSLPSGGTYAVTGRR